MIFRKLFTPLTLSIGKYSTKSGVAEISGLGKKKLPQISSQKKDVGIEIERDVSKLLNYVCGTNLSVEGGEDVMLKPDSEYPAWLWTIGKPLPLEELDRNSVEFWKRVHSKGLRQQRYLRSLMKTSTVHK